MLCGVVCVYETVMFPSFYCVLPPSMKVITEPDVDCNSYEEYTKI